MSIELDSPVQFLKGVGPYRAGLLEHLGLRTARDVLFHIPRDYSDRSRCIPIAETKLDATALVRGRVLDVRSRRTRGGKTMLSVTVGDDSGALQAVFFNQPFLEKQFQEGQELVLWGKVGFYGGLQMASPTFEVVEEDEADSDSVGRVVPVYPLTEGLSQGQFRKIVRAALDGADALPDIFDAETQRARKLLPLAEALRQIHFPDAPESVAPARRRLAYEEFFLLELGMALRRRALRDDTEGYAHRVTPHIDARIRKRFPFRLTGAQDAAIEEIAADMAAPKPMNRILQGDVGSGKTVVALYAMLVAVANRRQAVLMAPTEILAEQHHATLSRYLEGSRVRWALLSGGLPAAKRRAVLADIAAGKLDLVVGTHALLEGDVAFADLGLVVVDEQHKFGVLQRAKLRGKGAAPDVLVMTATPIPRTLSLTIFGDLDISTIRELPPGRGRVITRFVPPRREAEAHGFIRKQLAAGRQAYVVYPLIEESDRLDLRAATEMAETLKNEVFPEFAVGLLHGGMKSAEKDEVMRRFREGEVRVLVSTVVIEVGVDVPNATVMVIEHAERYGLAQLHQLRGRIGRGSHVSYCLLFGRPGTEEAQRRLDTIVSTTNGFRIAEEDLKLRGPGEFFGTRQHGLPELRVGHILDDFALLQMARRDAFALAAADPRLEQSAHHATRAALHAMFASRLHLIEVA